MKYLVVFCLLPLAYGLPPEIVEQIKQEIAALDKECKLEVEVGDDEIVLLKNQQLPATHEGKCFIACLQKKFGFQDKAGKINKEVAYTMIEQIKELDEDLYGKMKQAADNCYEKLTDTDDECLTAYNMMECFTGQYKTLGIKPLNLQ